MANGSAIAFAVSSIPLDTAQGERGQYDRLVSFIRDQYRELTGAAGDLSVDIIFSKDRVIKLPCIVRIPLDDMRKYYKLTIEQLRQAA